ncbi:regulator of G-protein signaling 7 [Galendromus occidentalis]|uniref:Regulator of G-protein signaling 7 n=1 Tax=Galendromus occidentalis TaxID=34638 RepID=A0AAJ7SIN1_9ACAR|nr:regulator of G-protein signaling 7 [Galendromus occidentalis]
MAYRKKAELAGSDNPHQIVCKKMENLIGLMQHDRSGVPVRTVKKFLSKIPSVFTGADLIQWVTRNLEVEDQQEALHLMHLIASYGYLFPIDDHVLTVKNDQTYYRFQTPYFWPSNSWEPENNDYAVYLCKRTMQNKTRLELADYEAENLARLQKMFSRKWEFIFMRAEAQAKVDKKRDKIERKVLDSQERAFWDVHRPVPGCVNTTEVDVKKACRMNKNKPTTSGETASSSSATPMESLKAEAETLRARLDRVTVKSSKVAESYLGYFEQYAEYDAFVTPAEPSNPWISDSTEMWEAEKQNKEIAPRRVRRWAFSLNELLRDPAGKEQFFQFLEKEFSAENLKFWDAVQDLRRQVHSKEVSTKVHEIWNEYLAPEANCPINIDSKSFEHTKTNVGGVCNRWTFEEAAAHVYQLMKNDSYPRYLRSAMYKEFLNGTKKKTSVKGLRSVISFTATRKES